jgi:hypothetical protein
MKIVMHLPRQLPVPIEPQPVTIQAFADGHGLEMHVHQRALVPFPKGTYYANFPDAEIKDGYVLVGEHGNGDTPEEAIADYARKISGKLLVLHAGADNRSEIQVPTLK